MRMSCRFWQPHSAIRSPSRLLASFQEVHVISCRKFTDKMDEQLRHFSFNEHSKVLELVPHAPANG